MLVWIIRPVFLSYNCKHLFIEMCQKWRQLFQGEIQEWLTKMIRKLLFLFDWFPVCVCGGGGYRDLIAALWSAFCPLPAGQVLSMWHRSLELLGLNKWTTTNVQPSYWCQAQEIGKLDEQAKCCSKVSWAKCAEGAGRCWLSPSAQECPSLAFSICCCPRLKHVSSEIQGPRALE